MPVVPPSTIAVTITGTGDSSKCFVIINDTKQYSAGTHEVNVGDMITFGAWGSGSDFVLVIIDGTKVLESTTNQLKTYDWTVPSDISTVEIAMEYSRRGRGTITVTTT